MSNLSQIVYNGPSLSVDVEPPQAPAIPTDGEMYLNSGDFVPYFCFDALADGEADSYETEAWKSSAPGTIVSEETDADIYTVIGGVKKIVRTYPVSGTGLGTITPGTTINARARAKFGNLYSEWTDTYSVLYTF